MMHYLFPRISLTQTNLPFNKQLHKRLYEKGSIEPYRDIHTRDQINFMRGKDQFIHKIRRKRETSLLVCGKQVVVTRKISKDFVVPETWRGLSSSRKLGKNR